MRFLSLLCLVCFSLSTSAQSLTKQDVEKALVEHHAALPGFCLATVGLVDAGELFVGSFDTHNVRNYLIQSGHFEPREVGVRVSQQGRPYVLKNVSFREGRASDCFAIGKTALDRVELFRPVMDQAEVTYAVTLTDLPAWLKSIRTEPNQAKGADIDWIIERTKNAPGHMLVMRGMQANLINANGRWMTMVIYERLRRGIK